LALHDAFPGFLLDFAPDAGVMAGIVPETHLRSDAKTGGSTTHAAQPLYEKVSDPFTF